jgi:hypothetical protein
MANPGPSPQDQWLQNPAIGVPAAKFTSSGQPAAGPGGAPGFPYSIVIPLETPEVPAWGGKIKVKYKGQMKFEGTVGGPTGSPVLNLDASKGIGLKASKVWWQGTGSVKLFGTDILKNPKLDTEGTFTDVGPGKGVTVKMTSSVDTPLGTAFVSCILVDYKAGKDPVYGALAGGLKGKKPFGDMTVDGVSIHDISVTSELSFQVAPQYVKIMADTILEGLKKAGKNVAETVTTDAALGFAIDASLVVVAIGTVAGVFNELAKAADQAQLRSQVMLAVNLYTTGLGKAFRGEPSPGSGWPGAGWNAGKKVFDNAVAKAKSLHSNWSDDQIREKVIAAASRVETSADVQTAIKRNCGQGFWDRWIDANHGVTTFLGDAKEACTACFGTPVTDNNDPALAAWKKVSKLPDFLADR